MKILNKLYKFIIIIPALIIILLAISCSYKSKTIKFDNDISIYSNETTKMNNIIFKNNYSYIEYNDHVLELVFNVNIKNNNEYDVILNLSDSKAYGNDSILPEEVLDDYNYSDLTKTKIFTNDTVTIIPNEEVSLNYYLVIKDGNSICKYALEFKINNMYLNLYSYKEGYELDKFYYIHNPLYQSKVLEDAKYDYDAVFGFVPTENGSLKNFASYNWYDSETVMGYKEERMNYIQDTDRRIKELEKSLREDNSSIEEIARACSTLRNQIRLEQYQNDPEGLARIKERNLELYGHEEGPLPDELYIKYGSWEIVLEKCYSSNRGMDACCGIYDQYFYMYNKLAY